MRLPLTPGVYIMKDKKNNIIYIGKAKALKNRVSQYFGSQNNHTVKVRRMVENVEDFDYILVGSEFEALVLECSLIKQHAPKYNILLKDDKGYHYIRIGQGEWKSLSAVKQKLDDGAKYLGPYTSSDCVNRSVEEACRIFRLPVCSKVFPRDIKTDRPCLYYYIKQCSAPCAGRISKEEHNLNVDNAVKFVTGGSENIIRDLKKRMELAAEALEFERAAALRDSINAIEKTANKQSVVSVKTEEQDVFALSETPNRMCLMVLRVADGRLYDSEYFICDACEDADEAMPGMITEYYSIRDFIPKVVSVDRKIADSEIIERWLGEKSGHSVKIRIPEKGENARLMSLCRTNAAEKLAQSVGRAGRDIEALDELKELLGLEKIPEYIESYDISHTDGADNVAGMVVFKNGKPLKSAYRKFSIKSFSGQDDCRSMAEVLTRRMNEYVKRVGDGENEGFGRLPDLILLDGSHGQVNAVKPVLDSFGVNVPLFGMVKDSKHRTRAIAFGGGEISIADRRKVFTLVSDIQEEVHRFSVSYHRNKQSSSLKKLALTEIDGVGEARAKALLKKFKTISAVGNASVEELCRTDSITEAVAVNIYKYYHGKNS